MPWKAQAASLAQLTVTMFWASLSHLWPHCVLGQGCLTTPWLDKVSVGRSAWLRGGAGAECHALLFSGDSKSYSERQFLRGKHLLTAAGFLSTVPSSSLPGTLRWGFWEAGQNPA